MKISIIIPTYNRSEIINCLFDALENQTNKDFEVVVSSDGSTDSTIEVIETLKKKYSFELILVNNAHLGRASCRNAGVNAANGELLIFYDDDVRPNQKSVETHYSHHKNFPNTICTGPVYYEKSKLITDFQHFRANMEHSWYPKENNRSLKAGMPGANWSIMKSDFLKLGKLNKNLTDSEDFEFSYRATHIHKIAIYFKLDTWVYHDDYKSIDQYLDRYILGNISLLNLFEQDQKIREDYWKKLYIKKSISKSIFLRIFNTNNSISFTNSSLFKNLPQRIRYKIYDFIITAQTRYFLNENFNSYTKNRS